MTLDEIKAEMQADLEWAEKNPMPVCIGCGKTPDEIDYIVDEAEDMEISPEQWVKEEEGTYNKKNGHFACDTCYIKMGQPSSPNGWVAP